MLLLHVLSLVYSISIRDSVMSFPNLWGCGLFICGFWWWFILVLVFLFLSLQTRSEVRL